MKWSRIKHFCFGVFLLLSLSICAQEVIKEGVFQSPMKGALDISGTFCAIRSNHFHAGIDIRTNAEEGWEVFSIGEGYVSRIKVSPYGYGNALYLTHPNGFTSVYAHLKSFHPEIQQWVRNCQYQLKKWELDTILPRELLNIKQGDLIAYSGNTGSSGGPHLHFEIRKTRNNQLVNPLLFGLFYKDSTPPKFNGLRIYHSQDSLLHNRRYKDYTLKKNKYGKYYIPKNVVPHITGYGGIGIDIQDFQDLSKFRNDVYRIKMYVDDALIYDVKFDSLLFDYSRFSNAQADYYAYISSSDRIHQLFRLPNMPVDYYLSIKNNGIISSGYQKQSEVKIVIADFKDNKAELSFNVHTVPPEQTKNCMHHHMQWEDAHELKNNEIQVYIPEKALYENEDIKMEIIDSILANGKPFLRIGKQQIPLQKEIKVSFPKNIFPSEHSDHLFLECKNSFSKRHYHLTSASSHLESWVKELGTYAVVLDTLAPIFSGGNIFDSSVVSTIQPIYINISDDFSGIQSFNATLNGEWILMEYEHKTNQLFHLPDGKLKPGFNVIEIYAEDQAGNSTTMKCNIQVIDSP